MAILASEVHEATEATALLTEGPPVKQLHSGVTLTPKPLDRAEKHERQRCFGGVIDIENIDDIDVNTSGRHCHLNFNTQQTTPSMPPAASPRHPSSTDL